MALVWYGGRMYIFGFVVSQEGKDIDFLRGTFSAILSFCKDKETCRLKTLLWIWIVIKKQLI